MTDVRTTPSLFFHYLYDLLCLAARLLQVSVVHSNVLSLGSKDYFTYFYSRRIPSGALNSERDEWARLTNCVNV